MFVIRHNSGLYLYHQMPSESFKEWGKALVWLSINATKDAPQLFKTAVLAHNYIHDHHLGSFSTVQQVVKDKISGTELDEMLWLVREIEGLAVKVIPFYPVPHPEEVILSLEELIFEF